MDLKYLKFCPLIFIILLAMINFTTASSIAEQNNIPPPPEPPGWDAKERARDELMDQNKSFDLMTTSDLFLNSQWNLISIPKTLQSGYDTAGAVFGGIDMDSHSVLVYNAAAGRWEQLLYNSVLHPLDGIFIYSKYPCSITLHYADPLPPPPSKQLYSGWNLVGFGDLEPAPAWYELLSVKNQWIKAQGWDAYYQRYETAIYVTASWRFTDPQVYPTKGYWVYLSNPGILQAYKEGDDVDGMHPEVGIEWKNNYWPPYAPLSYSDDECIGFYNTLGQNGYTKKFNYGDDAASMDHWYPPSWFGHDNDYIDGVDIAYYSGHGSSDRIILGPIIPTQWIYYQNCIWGDNDIEWLFLSGCNSTADISKFQGSNKCLRGIHVICGAVTSIGESDRTAIQGTICANLLFNGNTVKDSWFGALDTSHGAGTTLRVIGENLECMDDHMWGTGNTFVDPPIDEYVEARDYYCQGV